MTGISEIAQRFLNRSPQAAAYWEAMPEAVALFQFIHIEGVWIDNYKDRIQAVRSKKTEDLRMDEIQVYLTPLPQKNAAGAHTAAVLRMG